MAKIKPCPLCGRRPEISFYLDDEDFSVKIRCNCGISISDKRENSKIMAYNPGQKFIEMEDKLINTWNKRTVDDNKNTIATNGESTMEETKKSNNRWQTIWIIGSVLFFIFAIVSFVLKDHALAVACNAYSMACVALFLVSNLQAKLVDRGIL